MAMLNWVDEMLRSVARPATLAFPRLGKWLGCVGMGSWKWWNVVTYLARSIHDSRFMTQSMGRRQRSTLRTSFRSASGVHDGELTSLGSSMTSRESSSDFSERPILLFVSNLYGVYFRTEK